MILLTSVAVALMLGQQTMKRTDVRLSVNGEDVTFGVVQPFIKSGFTLVPVRGVFEKIGAKVDFDSKTRTVMAYKPGIEVVLKIGSNTALVNNQEKNIPMAAQIISGSTMVPLRFISETMGASVSYDEKANWINIYVPQEEQNLQPGTPPPHIGH